jgi:hypothetical protein
MPEGLDPRNKIARWFVRDPSVRLGGDGRGEEAMAFKPSIFKPKPMGFRSGGWNVKDEGNVVGG